MTVSAHRLIERVVFAVGRARCVRYFHKWEQTAIGWPYEEYWYCARFICGAKTWDEERTFHPLRFDLERVGLLRRAFHWYDNSRFAS